MWDLHFVLGILLMNSKSKSCYSEKHSLILRLMIARLLIVRETKMAIVLLEVAKLFARKVTGMDCLCEPTVLGAWSPWLNCRS